MMLSYLANWTLEMFTDTREKKGAGGSVLIRAFFYALMRADDSLIRGIRDWNFFQRVSERSDHKRFHEKCKFADAAVI